MSLKIKKPDVGINKNIADRLPHLKPSLMLSPPYAWGSERIVKYDQFNPEKAHIVSAANKDTGTIELAWLKPYMYPPYTVGTDSHQLSTEEYDKKLYFENLDLLYAEICPIPGMEDTTGASIENFMRGMIRFGTFTIPEDCPYEKGILLVDIFLRGYRKINLRSNGNTRIDSNILVEFERKDGSTEKQNNIIPHLSLISINNNSSAPPNHTTVKSPEGEEVFTPWETPMEISIKPGDKITVSLLICVTMQGYTEQNIMAGYHTFLSTGIITNYSSYSNDFGQSGFFIPSVRLKFHK